MSLTNLKIRNFQAHKDLEIPLDPHITTITGPSDRGKSAILRALIWVMTNKPNGDDFIRYGTSECSVTLSIDGHIVERTKNKKENKYVFDGIEYKAIKTDVPEDIDKIFNINSNNIQQQFDNIFWFSETAGEVGRNLNSIVNLDIIDFVMRDISSRLTEAKNKNSALKELIEEDEKSLKNEKNILLLKRMCDRYDELDKSYQEKQSKISSLEKLSEELSGINIFLDKGEQTKKLQERLEKFINNYFENQEEIKRLTDIIQKIESINIPKPVPEKLLDILQKLTELNNKISDTRIRWKKLNEVIENIEDIDETINDSKNKLKQLEEKFHSITKDQICPLCGNKFNKE